MTIDEAIKNLEYGTEQLEMEIKSGLWIKGSEPEMRCKEGVALNKQHIEWLKELKDLREENKMLIQKCDKLIKEKGTDVQLQESEWQIVALRTIYDDIPYGHSYVCKNCGHTEGRSNKYCGGCGCKMIGVDYG